MKTEKPIIKQTVTNEKKLCGCGNVVLCKGMCNACYKYHRYHSFKTPKNEASENCECGKAASTKGMCPTCYNNSRYKLDIDYTPTYKKVLAEVKKGSTITAALKFLKIYKKEFYVNITAQQKREINECKIIYNTPINSFFEDLD